VGHLEPELNRATFAIPQRFRAHRASGMQSTRTQEHTLAPRIADWPLVSIVMPTYNRAHMVGQAIDAILGQTYLNLELIIVNDGSHDGTRDLLDEYARRDPRVRVIHKINEGIPDTVNRGWHEARGKYVTWTSDDNLYHRSAIARMVSFLETRSDIALVYTDARYIDGAGDVLGYPQGHEPHKLEDYCAIAGCLLFRREVFDHLEMFRRQWKRCHDFDFYHRVYKRFGVARIPEVHYDYRLHAASMTGDHWAMTTEHATLLASYATDRKGRRAAWAGCWHEIARQAQRERRDWKAVWYYLRAAILQPSRFQAFWRTLWTTCYGFVPRPIQRSWRSIKRSRFVGN
jgi:glycosyltransferase involved in cell wall biosynthesis